MYNYVSLKTVFYYLLNKSIYHGLFIRIVLQLEEYGLITAWTVSSRNMSFILETDIEHLTSFITGVMQEQYCINNGLLLTRIQCIYYSCISKSNIIT